MVRSTGRRLSVALLAASLLVLPSRPLLASPAEHRSAATSSWLGTLFGWLDPSGWRWLAGSEAVVGSEAPPEEPPESEAETSPPDAADVALVEQEQDSGPLIDPNG